MSAFLVVLLVLIALVVGGAFLLLIGPYNALVRLRNTVQEAWRQVDVELNRRYDLIPNLVETVKGYAGHESKTLENIVSLRNAARGAASSTGGEPTQNRAEIEAQLSQAVTQFLAVVESYPELKANQNFLELQRQLAETEDRISNGRRYYNAVVSDYNTKVESFPSNIAAGMFKFQRAGYFEANDPAVRQSPRVSFDQGGSNTLPPVQDSRPALGDIAGEQGQYSPMPQQNQSPQQYYPEQPGQGQTSYPQG